MGKKFLGNIRGPQGPQGERGAKGERGPKGDKGDVTDLTFELGFKASKEEVNALKQEIKDKADKVDVETKLAKKIDYTEFGSAFADALINGDGDIPEIAEHGGEDYAHFLKALSEEESDERYQPKGNYLTKEAADGAYQPKIGAVGFGFGYLPGNRPGAIITTNTLGITFDKPIYVMGAPVATKADLAKLGGGSADYAELARRIPSWQWKVTLPKSDHQTVTATVGTQTYTDDFYAPQGSNVTFSVKADTGYIAGVVSPTSATLDKDLAVTVTAAAESEELEAGTKTFTSASMYPYPEKTDSFIVPPKVYVLKWTWGGKDVYSAVVPGKKFEAAIAEAAGFYTLVNAQGFDKNAFGVPSRAPLTVSWSKEINEHAVDVDWTK